MEGRPLSTETAATRWTFGVEPLPQAREVASRLRSLAGLVLSLEAPHPALDRLIAALRDAESELAALAPRDPAPRIGDAPPDARIYLDHSSDVGAFNPCFPTYRLQVDGQTASGTVAFPLVFEGPPGIVHGGFLALFFDQVVQHHNCELGLAGRTTSLALTYRRPTPLLRELDFEVTRSVDERRITSEARLMADGALLCEAVVRAVVGDRTRLPAVSPRRGGA